MICNRNAFFRRNCSLIFLGGILVAVTLLQSFPHWVAIRWDGKGYHIWTHAILRGDLNFDGLVDDTCEAGLYYSDDARHFYHNKYPPGVAIIRLPVMMLFADTKSMPPVISREEDHAAFILGALALWGVAFFGLQSCRLIGVPGWSAHLATLAIIFGTGLFHYGTFFASYSHIWSALGLSILMYLGIKTYRSTDGNLPLFATAATVMMLVLIRNTNALAIAVMTSWFAIVQLVGGRLIHSSVDSSATWRSVVRNLLLVMVAGAVGLGIQVAINSHAYGRLVWSSYGTEEFLWHRPMQWSVLMAYEQGLLLYYPIVAIVVLAGLCFRETLWATLGLTLILACLCTVYGYWHSWMLGAGFGHRGFVDVLPPAIPILAVVLARASLRWRIVLLTAMAIAIFVTMEMLAGYWRETLPWQDMRREFYLEHLYGKESLIG